MTNCGSSPESQPRSSQTQLAERLLATPRPLGGNPGRQRCPVSPAASAPRAPPLVAQLQVPDGEEDPIAFMQRGGMEVAWAGTRVRKFQHQSFGRLVDPRVRLPTLYLHFLPDAFRMKHEELDPALRCGNDNSEVQIVLPEMFTGPTRPPHTGGPELENHLKVVLAFLKSQARVPTTAVRTVAAGFSPKKNYKVAADAGRCYYTLRTSRPKADISLDKASFGIPEEADLYLLAENHESIPFMSDAEKAAFEECILGFGEDSEEWKGFGLFLKLFYEGGFAYNRRMSTGENSYVPKICGLASLGVTPAFEGQAGISTGYPYMVRPEFLKFSDTTPVTIGAIGGLSKKHKRYGLCFTRSVFVWADEDFDCTKTLNFCSILPHGGFFYAPETLGEFRSAGGLVYAFGEEKDTLGVASEEALRLGAPASAPAAAEEDAEGVCVICLDQDATCAAVPCGHRAYCPSCAPAIVGRLCPVCRTPVRETLRVF